MRRLASEFPNDNPALHGGTRWTCFDVTGLASPDGEAIAAVTSDTGAASDDESLEAIVVEELEPVLACVEGNEATSDSNATEDAPPRAAASGIFLIGASAVDAASIELGAPPPPALPVVAAEADPFHQLLDHLAHVARARGGAKVASLLPELLLEDRVPDDADVVAALREAGLVIGDDVAPTLVRVTRAWRSVLSNATDDFDDCGPATLDEWAASLLGVVLRSPSETPAIRRELRERGVLAFGLVSAA